MNKQDLLELEKLATRTPSEIEKQQPALHAKISQQATTLLKKTVRARLKNAPKEIKDNLSRIDFSPDKLGKQDIKAILTKNILDDATAAGKVSELSESITRLPHLGKLDDFIQPDLPVFVNPVFQQDLMKAKVYRISDIAGLSEAKTEKALKKELSLDAVSSVKLDKLVKDKILTKREAKELGVTSNLYTLFDTNFELTEHVKKTAGIQSVKDLVAFDRSKWLDLIKGSKMELPGELKQEEYADVLYKKVENLFPEASLSHHITQVDPRIISKGLKALKPLLGKNKAAFGAGAFEDLKKDGLTAAKTKKLKKQFEDINRISRLHPGLKLDEVLNSKKLSDTEKGKRVAERIGLFDKFVKNNADLNLFSLDYKHDSDDLKALNFQGFKPAEQIMVLNSAKAYQRIHSFTNDVEHTEAIMAAGFHSSYQVTSVTLPEFIQATQLDSAIATRYFENAHMSIIRTTGIMGSILDILTGSFAWTAVGNTNPAIQEYLRDIPGYQDLFGAMAFCDCEHCQSIYSPAAYFVDLMQFVERYVLSKHFTDSKASHVLNLKVRRPDLWSLPLTCENTTTLMPYLEIINEILESFIANKKGFTGDLSNRGAVEKFVYRREIALEISGGWKDHVHSFKQPFHLPMESVSVYLGHFEKTREEIAILFNKPQNEVSKARLNLSEKQYQLITRTDDSPEFIKRVYGVAFTITAGKISPFDAQLLLKPMGVNRKDLEKVLKSSFVTRRGAEKIVIQGEKTDADSIQNDIERVSGLTYAALDRAHRLVRLLRKTSWTIEELDLVLTQLREAGLANGVNPDAVTEIGRLARLQEMLKISVEELSGLWHELPAKAINDNQRSLFDSLFNHEDVLAIEGKYPKKTTKFIHPSLILDRSTSPVEYLSDRLMAALNRSDDEILILIQKLSQPLGIVALNSATESERGFDLTATNLSLLYRHSKLAELLNIAIQDFFGLIALIPDLANGYVETIDHIYKVLEFQRWWKSTSYSLDDLHFITESGNVANPENYKSEDEIATTVLEQIKAANALVFADTLFSTFFSDITEEQSKAIIQANQSIIELSPDGRNFWLKPEFDVDTAIDPAGVSRPEPELRKFLIKYHPKYLVPFQLSGLLQLSEDSITRLIGSLSTNLDNKPFTLELQGITNPAKKLTDLIKRLLPLSLVFRDKKFTAEALTYVLDNLSVFGITDLDTITIDNIQRLHSFIKHVQLNEDGTSNVAKLTSILKTFDGTTQFQNADQEKLAEFLQATPELLATIHPVAIPSTDGIHALDHYKNLSGACSYIGIGGDVLMNVLSTQYEKLSETTLAIVAAFRSKYRTEVERKEKLEKYQDELLSRKRASLTTYLIHSGFPQFENENDLFHHFLIDTELEGCARTSRLVAATMSLQLYIHRILLNLEQDNQDPGTPGRVFVRADAIPGDEWEWRRNYRVWEANRKVFLYPENYIEPELRDDKTPLFEELEDELLQQEINADTVLDAYGKYMRGFDEVAHLKIAGSFHEKDADTQTDVLHLFGVTADEPPLYYYRRVENVYYSEKQNDRGVVWAPWQKINVQIPVRKVAPIAYNGRLHVFWVRVTTLANTVFDDNRSVFIGYSHKVSIEFTTLKLDGTWTPPQKLNLKDCIPFSGNGVVQDPLAEDLEIGALRNQLHEILRSFPFFNFSALSDEIRALKTPRYDIVPHNEALDEYTLQGFLWDQVYPAIDDDNQLNLTGMGYQLRAALDFYNLSLQNNGAPMRNVVGFSDPVQENITLANNKPGKILAKSGSALHRAVSPSQQLFDHYAYGSLIVNATKTDPFLVKHWLQCTMDNSFDGIVQEKIAELRPGTLVQIINGAYGDAVIDVQGDLLLLQGTPVDGNEFLLRRLGTTLSETLTRTLFTSGVDTALSIETQKALKEAVAPITLTASTVENLVVKDKLDFKGAYGIYYREIFFHIPFLIANHLNSQGKYADAQKWYHYIFNPSATEVIDFSAPGLTPAQKKKMELDRNWQYLEFREIDTQKLRDQLNDKEAIEAYKKDPFNPHAIARLRLSAYQKSIVMKYIDNLLDWGDQLFTQDTMESVNEATLLYVLAREILGDRPVQIGDCGEGNINPKTYENIQPLLNKGSEFLAELESYTFVKPSITKPKILNATVLLESAAIFEKAQKVAYEAKTYKGMKYSVLNHSLSSTQLKELKVTAANYVPKITIQPPDNAFTGKFSIGTLRVLDWKTDSIYVKDKFKLPSFGSSIVSHVSPVFCVPGNKDLLDYYARVDDRLFKIRNCMNIQGQIRQLALFAPEIDPRLLVRARAAGLSLDDILNSLSGNLPPYRFVYILERAKTFTSVVQSFGASLLSAIEKKNAEELALLRMTQQQNILEMSSKSRKLDIDSANEGINALNDRIESLNYQIAYYDGLINQRLNGNEILQSESRHTVTEIRVLEATLGFLAGTLNLLPQLGSPFAMKYGGVELGESGGKFFNATSSLGTILENIGASAGLEAGFDRRSEGWKHQKKLLQSELKQATKNLKATELRRDILIEAEKIHQKNIEHNNDVMEFYGEKFSNLGLYTWLSATMQRLFKEAYNNALSIARLAEQAYRFERDDNTFFIDGTYFDSSKAGLLAGERLLMALQTMERRYLETNYRKNEIDQAFSLTQINPAALLLLKQTGTCEFTIPEIFYDLFYPGQYRRKIQSVRLTIPSITGPYTNVSATLSLVKSQIRMEPKLGSADLKDVPKSRTTIIATSTAQNDAGVFQLNFRDDRYMPFEGAGAISTWRLSLPKNFRQFDYKTINEIIVHLSYTAEYDELFRDKVEEQNEAIEGTLVQVLKNQPLFRTISLRQEFSTDFHRLTQQPVDSPVTVKIQNKHFPLFLNGKNLKVTQAKLVLTTPVGQTVAKVKISINGDSQTGFAKDPALGDLFTKDLGNLFNAGIIKEHTITITDGGDLTPAAPAVGPAPALDTEKLEDMILYIEYKLG